MQINVEKGNESSTMQSKNYVEHDYRRLDYNSGTVTFIFCLYGKLEWRRSLLTVILDFQSRRTVNTIQY